MKTEQHDLTTLLRVLSSRCLLCTLLFAYLFIPFGCQNSDGQYQEVTEELIQPERETVVSKDEALVPPDNSVVPSVESSSENSVADETKQASIANADTTSSETSIAQADNQGTKDVEVEADTTDDSNSKSEPPSATIIASGNFGGLINLDEERRRQQRLNLLGLGAEEPKEPREIKLLIKEKDFPVDDKNNSLRLSYDDIDLLKVLNMDPVPLDAAEYLPEWLAGLDGRKVTLRGWMYPTDKSEDLKGFIFVRDNQVCCFGPNAKAYDKMTVRLKPGVTSDYIQGRPFDVVGTFHVDPWIEDERDMRTGAIVEKLAMLYHIEDAIILDEK